MTVVSVDANGSGRNEVNGAQFFACLNIDDIIDAYDNNDVLKGSLNNANGNGNNYSIQCSDPVSIDGKAAGALKLGVVYGVMASLSIIS